MRSYIEGILTGIEGLKAYQSPANNSFFAVSPDESKLVAVEAKRFHTVVAKLLYLSRRARPDIIVTVSFLCTRVKEPMVGDRDKLFHLLGYLKRMKG
jgi:hypothetical protein